MTRETLTATLALAILAAPTLAGKHHAPGEVQGAKPPHHELAHAVAVLVPTTGSQVRGVVHFDQEMDGVRVRAEVSGLSPGRHGFHIHQYGDCSSGDGTSAGGHFNPQGHEHGGPMAAVRHVGDLGNLFATSTGEARYDKTIPGISLMGSETFIGRGLIVHAGADDLRSQPTGNAGGRAACGVIGVGK